MNFVISGGTGFIGSALAQQLTQANHSVVLLTRSPTPARGEGRLPVKKELWDARTPGSWVKRIDGSDAVINLAGETLAGKRWTKSQKARIVDSRLYATKAI